MSGIRRDIRSDMRIVPLRESSHGPCPCCGDTARTVWGEVRVRGGMRAIYYVRWSPEHLDEHAVWLLYIGPWGRATAAPDRVAVALHCRSHRGRPAYAVVDALHTPWGESAGRLGQPLRRAEVIGQPVAQEAFAIVGQVLSQDARVARLMRSMFAAEPPRWRRWLADRWGIRRRHRGAVAGARRSP